MLSEKLVIAEARVEQLGHEIKRAEEVVAGKNALLQELQATAQRERVEMDSEIKRLTFALQESTMLRNRDHEEARQRKIAEQHDSEQAMQVRIFQQRASRICQQVVFEYFIAN